MDKRTIEFPKTKNNYLNCLAISAVEMLDYMAENNINETGNAF